MTRTFSTAALNNTNQLNQIAALINGRNTENLNWLNTLAPNENHAIPATPTAGQVLGATDANTLTWLTITNLIKAGQDATAYTEDDIILWNNNLYLVLNDYTSGTPFAETADISRVSGYTSAEIYSQMFSKTRYQDSYTDAAGERTYNLTDGERYFIDAIPGGITTETFELPDLSGATTEFSFTILPRERDFTSNPLTIQRNSTDNTAQFFTMANPTSIIADDVTINTNGEFEFIGRREGSQTKWTVIKKDYS